MLTNTMGIASSAWVMLKTSSVKAASRRGVPRSSSRRKGTVRILRIKSRRKLHTAPWAKLASIACDTNVVMILPAPRMTNPQTKAFGRWSAVRAAVTKAMMPMLHAPLSSAVPVVRTIMPRQVRQMNLSKFMREGLGASVFFVCGFGEAFLDLFGEELDIGIDKDVFVGAGNVSDRHAAAHEFAPAEIFRKGAQDGLAARAQERDAACIGTLDMGDKRVQVNLPVLQLAFREMIDIDDFIEIHIVPVAALEFCGQFAPEHPRLAHDVTAAFTRFEQREEILHPIEQVARKTIMKGGLPP